MKYVMFEAVSEGGIILRYPIIFPVRLVHEDVARVVGPLVEENINPKARAKVRVVGAGECYTSASVLEDSFSYTLGGLRPHPEDEQVINSIDYFHGIVSEKAKIRKRKEPK